MTHGNKPGVFTPTPEQAQVLRELYAFADPAFAADAFVLTGAAGTGKTSLVKALTAYLHGRNMPFRIAAPTARAAKVIAAKTGADARTLHSLIYLAEPLPNGPGVRLTPKDNKLERPTLYIVDEASMISDDTPHSDFFVSSEPVLSDFVRYVRAGHPQSKVLLLGDAYQLPPVGSDHSPALDPAYLASRLGLRVCAAELRQVLRQRSGSAILDNACALRECIRNKDRFDRLQCTRLRSAADAAGAFVQRFDPTRLDAVALIAYTNNDVKRLNAQVRQGLGFAGAPLCAGDVVVLDANRWNRENPLFKGETGVVAQVGGFKAFAGLRFQQVDVVFGSDIPVSALCLLDTLESENGTLDRKAENLLYSEAMRSNPAFRRSKDPADDPHLSALRLRYGYALTGHKAQGGEWDCVILHPYLRADDYRWLYTAVTRARSELITWDRYARPADVGTSRSFFTNPQKLPL
jgi:exodeoxyribonuclease V